MIVVATAPRTERGPCRTPPTTALRRVLGPVRFSEQPPPGETGRGEALPER